MALDYGMKWNIARHLCNLGCRVTILPGTATSRRSARSSSPTACSCRTAPAIPSRWIYAIETIRELLGKTPIFGICLGHQLLSLACGATTFKLKFGHRGANQPVQNLAHRPGRNHQRRTTASPWPKTSLPATLEVTHRNLNDRTIEGVRHRELPAFSVQYHPEASAGPHDSSYLFGEFWRMIGKGV